jgi:hypothetical protein
MLGMFSSQLLLDGNLYFVWQFFMEKGILSNEQRKKFQK